METYMFGSDVFLAVFVGSAVIFSLAIVFVVVLIRREEVVKFHEREAKFLEDFYNDSK